jgi:hypothetical protein
MMKIINTKRFFDNEMFFDIMLFAVEPCYYVTWGSHMYRRIFCNRNTIPPELLYTRTFRSKAQHVKYILQHRHLLTEIFQTSWQSYCLWKNGKLS